MISEAVLLKLKDASQFGGLEITGVKLNLKCSTCGHTWGLYLNPNSNDLPYRWNSCMSCQSKKMEESKQHVIESFGGVK